MSEENKYTFENKEYRDTYRHTVSHILAQAVKRLYPEVKLAIGPSIDNGFYYDFDAPFSFTQEHLDALEAEMRKICKEKEISSASSCRAQRPSSSWKSARSRTR